MKKLFLIKIPILLVCLFVGYIFGIQQTTKVNSELIDKDKPEIVENNSIPTPSPFPFLDLPLKYFSVNNIRWGSAGGKGKEGTMEEYTEVALNNKIVYQSYPTTNTTIKQYSGEAKPLNTDSYSEIKTKLGELVGPESFWMDKIEESYKTYGKTALYFLSDSQVIEWTDEFDVDDDGKEEMIIIKNSIGRANAGSYTSAIIKNSKIIFSVDEDNSKIVPADTPNGFYVEWRDPEDDSARCCEQGYLRTRFVYKNNEFIPVYEQEIRYMKVGSRNNN